MADLRSELARLKANVLSGNIPDGAPDTIIGAVDRGAAGQDVDQILANDWALPDGYWVGFQSTYVLNAGWWVTDLEPLTGSIFVEFLSLAVVRYDGIPASMWRDFIVSPSHGMYTYYVLHPWQPQVCLRTTQRKVTKAMQDANYRRTRY